MEEPYKPYKLIERVAEETGLSVADASAPHCGIFVAGQKIRGGQQFGF